MCRLGKTFHQRLPIPKSTRCWNPDGAFSHAFLADGHENKLWGKHARPQTE
jgi:hypothetical protein